MKFREGKIPVPSLVIVSIITIFLMLIEFNSLSTVKAEYYYEKKAAAELTLQSYQAIKEAMKTLNISINSQFDPNETGLIGIPSSSITTGKGDLNAKLTSTNPHFAALIVAYIKEAGLNKNDIVAVFLTGSFPALNIAALSALKILELNPIIITSVGSTMWGANHPQFTYLDMERTLNQKGVHDFKTAAASVGIDDIGNEYSREGKKFIEASITKNNISFLRNEHLDEAIRKRIEIYTSEGKIKLFINVADHTNSLADGHVRSGLIKPREIKEKNGILAYFSKSGVPVINLVDVIDLAKKNHLPIAPHPLPNIDDCELYYTRRYSVDQAAIYLMILILIMFLVFKLDINYYIERITTRIQ